MIPPHIHLSLSGLSCGKCVAKVNDALKAQNIYNKIEVEKHEVRLWVDKALNGQLIELEENAIKSIKSLGYDAQVLSSQSMDDSEKITLKLAGLSCQKCVNKLTELLLSLGTLQIVHIDKNSATIRLNSSLSRNNPHTNRVIDDLIKAIENIGYHASLETIASKKDACLLPKTKSSLSAPLSHTLEVPKMTSGAIELTEENTTSSTQKNIESVNQSGILLIQGMSCASCVRSVETALQSVEGLEEYYVNLAQEKAFLVGAPSVLTRAVDTLTKAGYPSSLASNTPLSLPVEANKNPLNSLLIKTIIALSAGSLMMIYGLFGSMMLTDTNRIGWLITGTIVLFIMIFSGKHFFYNAWIKLKHKQTNMDTLVVIGISSAWLYSFVITLFPSLIEASQRHLYYEASVMIIGLINLGKYLEQKAKKKASTALSELLDLTPQTVIHVISQGDREILIDSVLPEMRLRLRTGDKVPVDGIITSGEMAINESLLTGESYPRHAKPNDLIFAGTLVESGSAIFEASKVGNQTALAHIIQTVQKAQSSKPKLAKLADRISSIFVPLILLLALCTALVWAFFGPEPKISYMLLTTVSVLIIACPCALGLAIPMSVITSVGHAAKLGILVRDASVLERATQIDTLIFDKTGTLTSGFPEVMHVIPMNSLSEKLSTQEQEKLKLQLLHYAKLLEAGTHHPLAKAINRAFEEQQKYYAEHYHSAPLTNFEVTHFDTLTGLGVKGTIDTHDFLLGQPRLLEQSGIELSISEQHRIMILETQATGASTLYLAKNNRLIAIFIVADQIKTEAKQIIQTLKNTYEVWLLSGDNALSVNYVAKQVGIDNIGSEVKPLDKANQIKMLQAKGKQVAMIGDGINDAPALALADLSIAMGQGSDIAKQSADYILLQNDLSRLPAIFLLAKRVQRNMKQNLFFAFIYNLSLIPIAAGILYPINGLLLNPMLSALAMMLSSLTVVLNANRLLYKEKSQ